MVFYYDPVVRDIVVSAFIRVIQVCVTGLLFEDNCTNGGLNSGVVFVK